MLDLFVVFVSLELVSEVGVDECVVYYGYGLLYGFLLVLIVYNVMVFVGLCVGSYFYYVFYLLSFIGLNFSYIGYGFVWWWLGDVYF